LEYSEWIIRRSSCFTSAWKPRVSRWVVVVMVVGPGELIWLDASRAPAGAHTL
jgi:hypothetical protein